MHIFVSKAFQQHQHTCAGKASLLLKGGFASGMKRAATLHHLAKPHGSAPHLLRAQKCGVQKRRSTLFGKHFRQNVSPQLSSESLHGCGYLSLKQNSLCSTPKSLPLRDEPGAITRRAPILIVCNVGGHNVGGHKKKHVFVATAIRS